MAHMWIPEGFWSMLKRCHFELHTTIVSIFFPLSLCNLDISPILVLSIFFSIIPGLGFRV